MLPVTTGFIFPDGTKLDTGTKGHRKIALRYIKEYGLLDKYNAYEQKRGGGEDDFLIEVLGAVKVCHYNGAHFIYVPKLHGMYIDSIEKKYKKAGYNVQYYSPIACNVEVTLTVTSGTPYNRTVVMGVNEYGDKCYIYNPNREGD